MALSKSNSEISGNVIFLVFMPGYKLEERNNLELVSNLELKILNAKQWQSRDEIKKQGVS